MNENYNEEKQQVADMVKRIRGYAGLSQRMLSDKTGISQCDISKIERGLSNPSLTTLTRIANASGVKLKIDYVVENDDTTILIENLRGVNENIRELCREATLQTIDELGDDVSKVILFGSCARGENTDESDVDIAVLTKCDWETGKKYGMTLTKIASQFMIKQKELVNFVMLPISEYMDKKSWYPFYKNIDEEGIILYER